MPLLRSFCPVTRPRTPLCLFLCKVDVARRTLRRISVARTPDCVGLEAPPPARRAVAAAELADGRLALLLEDFQVRWMFFLCA